LAKGLQRDLGYFTDDGPMELVTILRELWRHRLLVIAGALLAISLGTIAAYRVSLAPPALHSRQFHVGLASTHLLIDTPDSQVVDLDPAGADALGTRTALLANLMVSAPVRTIIAQDAGLSPDQLLATTPSTTGMAVPTLLSQRAAAGLSSPEAYILTVNVEGNLPIISIQAQAPNAKAATRLADAATSGLRKYLSTVAATQQIPSSRKFVVRPMGADVAGEVVRGPRRLMAVIIVLFVFGFVCTAIVLTSGLARGWRQAAAWEARTEDPALADFPVFEDEGDAEDLDAAALRPAEWPEIGPSAPSTGSTSAASTAPGGAAGATAADRRV
jgi:hypothetical protein